MTPTSIVGFLALFTTVGFVFLLANLAVGWFLRANEPNEEKLSVYECGEPTIGSSFVQFDLRFYVIALLFIIFDVEVAFFFPWAVVFGKATHLIDAGVSNPAMVSTLVDLGVPQASAAAAAAEATGVQEMATRLTWMSFADIGVFFAVLLVGFAYVWRRGDLDWVRAVDASPSEVLREARPPARVEPVLTTTS